MSSSPDWSGNVFVSFPLLCSSKSFTGKSSDRHSVVACGSIPEARGAGERPPELGPAMWSPG